MKFISISFICCLVIFGGFAEEITTSVNITTNLTNSNVSNSSCLANPLCANNQDNFTCVDKPYTITDSAFCQTFLDNSTESCCSKDYLDKLEKTFLFYKNLLRIPAAEADVVIEDVQTNQSNFTEEVIQNLEAFANETVAVNITITRLRRTLLRKLEKAVSGSSSSTLIASEMSISFYANELITEKEKGLVANREKALLEISQSCPSKGQCKKELLEVQKDYESKIKDMKQTIIKTLEACNKKENTLIQNLGNQINVLIGLWEEEYQNQKEQLTNEASKTKITEFLAAKKEKLLKFLENAKTQASSSTNTLSTLISSQDNSLANVKAKLASLDDKYIIMKEEVQVEVKAMCTDYKLSEEECQAKLAVKLAAVEQAKKDEQSTLEKLRDQLEAALASCLAQGFTQEQCLNTVNTLNGQQEGQIQLQEQISNSQQQFANDLDKKCLDKGYSKKKCEEFVNKTVEEANQKAEQIKQQQQILNTQVNQATENALKECKKNKGKSSTQCQEEVVSIAQSYSVKLNEQAEKIKDKQVKVQETFAKETEEKCKGKSVKDCETITEGIKKQQEKSIKQMYEILGEPMLVQENLEAGETICVDNGIGGSTNCSEIMYEKLKKIKEQKTKLGLDDSNDQTLVLEETIELYQQIKNNCSNSKNQKKCSEDIEAKLKGIKQQHKDQLTSELIINDTTIDLSALLKGKLNKQIFNHLPIKNLNGLLKSYQNARKKCFSFILKLKSKLSCMACAGPSYFSQFIKNGSLHFHKNVCENTVKHCYDFFDLHEMASMAMNNIEALNESYSKIEQINEKVQNITKLIKEIKQSKSKKSSNNDTITAKISTVIDMIHEIEEIQGSKLEQKFRNKRKPKFCSSDTNCSYICDNFFSAAGLNTSLISDPGLEQEVDQVADVMLDVYENEENIPIELPQANTTISVEIDATSLEIQVNAAETITTESEFNAVDQLINEIYNPATIEITIDSGNRRRLTEAQTTMVWDDQGMDVEAVESGIDDGLLEFEEDPNKYLKENFAVKLRMVFIGITMFTVTMIL